MSDLYAQSTIAMTAYNVLATELRPSKVSDIHTGVIKQHPGLEMEDTEAALDELFDRGFITYDDMLGYDLLDEQRRVVVARDRSDGAIDDDGKPIGGWNKWMVKDGKNGLLLLSEVSR